MVEGPCATLSDFIFFLAVQLCRSGNPWLRVTADSPLGITITLLLVMERHWRFPFFSRRALARILAGGSQSRISHRTSIKIGASVCFGLLAISPQLYGQKNPWPTNPKWQHYVLGPNNPDVYPVKIVSVSGSVTNPQGLVNPNPSEGTTFTTSSASAPASVLLDYGQDTNGFPWFEVTSSQGSPTLVAAYSEGLQYIQANPTQGDNSPPYSSAGDPSRADSYTVTAPGTIVNQYIQGGERFQAIRGGFVRNNRF